MFIINKNVRKKIKKSSYIFKQPRIGGQLGLLTYPSILSNSSDQNYEKAI